MSGTYGYLREVRGRSGVGAWRGSGSLDSVFDLGLSARGVASVLVDKRSGVPLLASVVGAIPDEHVSAPPKDPRDTNHLDVVCNTRRCNFFFQRGELEPQASVVGSYNKTY